MQDALQVIGCALITSIIVFLLMLKFIPVKTVRGDISGSAKNTIFKITLSKRLGYRSSLEIFPQELYEIGLKRNPINLVKRIFRVKGFMQSLEIMGQEIQVQAGLYFQQIYDFEPSYDENDFRRAQVYQLRRYKQFEGVDEYEIERRMKVASSAARSFVIANANKIRESILPWH